MDLFQWKHFDPLDVLVFDRWYQEGVLHGFIGSSLWFRGPSLEKDATTLCRSVEIESMHVLHQVHSAEIVSYRRDHAVQGLSHTHYGDGWIGTVNSDPACALCIQTADCLPILLKTRDHVSALHAGWKGVASKIMVRALSLLDPNKTGDIEIIIGPSAQECCYEVGNEVVTEIGTHAAYTRSKNNERVMLSLQKTVVNQIHCYYNNVEVAVISAPVCTICNNSFHSHRRDGADRGSNISFIVPS